MFDLGLTVADKTQIVQSLAAKCTQSAANEKTRNRKAKLCRCTQACQTTVVLNGCLIRSVEKKRSLTNFSQLFLTQLYSEYTDLNLFWSKLCSCIGAINSGRV
jgi:hypothetical protein